MAQIIYNKKKYEFKIIINSVSSVNHKLIKEYWKIKNNSFLKTPKEICKIYNINYQQLDKIIVNQSRAEIIVGICTSCGNNIIRNAFSQQNFFEKLSMNDLCIDCERKNNNSDNSINVKYTKAELKRKELMQYALENQLWKELDDTTFDILYKIVELGDKKLIYDKVFKGNSKNKRIWNKVNILHDKGLIDVKRLDKTVIKFDFKRELFSRLCLGPKPKNIKYTKSPGNKINEDVIQFKLEKNPKKREKNHPYYSGVVSFNKTITIDKDVEYVYGGWVNPDGTIDIKIESLESVKQKLNKISKDFSNVKNILSIKDILDNNSFEM